MGWSCTQKAGTTLSKMKEICLAITEKQNCWEDNGKSFFFEIGREQRDGAITGIILRINEQNYIKKSGSLRIEPDGQVSRGPAIFKKLNR
jgi:hypothetical protein